MSDGEHDTDLDESTGRLSFPPVPAHSSMPEWYPALLESVSRRVTTGRTKAIAAANQELVATYWAIGKDLIERESLEGWGSKVVTRLSVDVRERFPDARGFSPRNLRYMKSFAEAWPDFPMLQQAVATLPWYHQITLLGKLDEADTRLWYGTKAAEEEWSRNVLAHHIETRLHERAGKAISSFKAIMPPLDSDLAQQTTKDPYIFDFVAMTGRRSERDLEVQLIDHVRKYVYGGSR